MALRALGGRPQWVGFAGGPTGKILIAGLQALGVETQATVVRAPTRENLAIVDDRGTVTEILEPGGKPSGRELDAFRKACERECARRKRKLLVVLSGSLPAGVPQDFYAALVRVARSHGCRIILDSSGEALRRGVAAGPDLVKPNREEAEALTGMEIQNVPSARAALSRILALGARSAAISLGKDGVLWGGQSREPLLARAPEVSGRSAVGSGDATVAGFAYGIAKQLSPRKTLALAVACGGANCLADSPGRIRLDVVRRIEKEVEVQTVGG